MSAILSDPKHWRERADEARRVANQLTDPDAKKTMLGIAASYDRLAERARIQISTVAAFATYCRKPLMMAPGGVGFPVPVWLATMVRRR